MVRLCRSTKTRHHDWKFGGGSGLVHTRMDEGDCGHIFLGERFCEWTRRGLLREGQWGLIQGGRGEQSKTLTIVLAVLAIYLVDFAINAGGIPSLLGWGVLWCFFRARLTEGKKKK